MKAATYQAVGRRKEAIARVRVTPGEGKIVVNKKPLLDFFKRDTLRMIVEQPLEVTETIGKYDISANVGGGGLSGMAGAMRLGIARALIEADESYRPKLKEAGFLTRDPRMKERKKYGQPGARKRFQFSKR
ncbi:30S ribosomal protein S9 [candidate division KSB1 bacterium]|nr:30S ribosomal protein S9 [candidate division KSB1 bacterium]NIR68462.1 30S ribosomal protein S9 [candidate division KSB1 bacterium]NIS25113.1 30S ribosomal protein S9 [candidate division KSB1 bacterium]NIT72025.1 30S ribosomal protein S9 [candidate division KSB1 bacterium]NIU25812.1 30S ribosomal protein S9 [candidate division KSB1 bacterium]